MTPKGFIKSLRFSQEREYAKAHLAYLREQSDKSPWEGTYGLNFKQAQAIRRRLGTLA